MPRVLEALRSVPDASNPTHLGHVGAVHLAADAVALVELDTSRPRGGAVGEAPGADDDVGKGGLGGGICLFERLFALQLVLLGERMGEGRSGEGGRGGGQVRACEMDK